MNEFAAWLWSALGSFFTSLKDFLLDFPILFFDLFLSGVAGLIENIVCTCFPVDGFATMGSLLSHLPSGVMWFLQILDFQALFVMLACGLSIRLTRKIVTLFQW